MVGCLISGASQSIAGQIAVKFALESFLRRVLDEPTAGGEIGSAIRDVFRESNQSVYEYAHRMRAGATIGASMMLWGLEHGRVSVGRSGYGDAFLIRDGVVTPLLEDATPSEGVLDRFVGANAKVLVDLASTAVREGDELLFLSVSASGERRIKIEQLFSAAVPNSQRVQLIAEGIPGAGAVSLVGYGHKAIELRNTVASGRSTEPGAV